MIGINIRVMMVPWSILILYNSIFHWTLFSNKPSLNAWMNLPWMFLLSFPDVSTFCPILHFSINLLLNNLSFIFLHWYFCYHLWEELWLTLILSYQWEIRLLDSRCIIICIDLQLNFRKSDFNAYKILYMLYDWIIWLV